MLILDESALARGTLGLLAMISSPTCKPCAALEPHLDVLQAKLSEDGVAIVIGVLDGMRYQGVADRLLVHQFPSFFYFPPFDSTPPQFFDGGASMKALVPWVLRQHAKSKSEQKPSLPTVLPPDNAALLHPDATRFGGRLPLRREPYSRSPPPPRLSAAVPTDCTTQSQAALMVIAGDLELADERAAEEIDSRERFAVGSWDVTRRRFVPLGSPRRPGTRDGALVGSGRALARNGSCVFAAGTLRAAAATPHGYEGDEEALVRWDGLHGWQALRGPLRRTSQPAGLASGAAVDQGKQAAAHPERPTDSPPTEDDIRPPPSVYVVDGGPVTALCQHGPLVYVGGSFALRRISGGRLGGGGGLGEEPEGNSEGVTASGEGAPGEALASRHLVAWDTRTSEWATLGGGLDASVGSLALDAHHSILYVSGGFTHAGHASAPYGLAAWDGRVWRVPPLSASPPTGGVRLLEMLVGGGRLYARAADGRIHVLQPSGREESEQSADRIADVGVWHVMPELPHPLRSVSALSWLRASATGHRAPSEGQDGAVVPQGGPDEGTLVAAGDVVLHAGGETVGVVSWTGSEWQPIGGNDGGGSGGGGGGSGGRGGGGRAASEGSAVHWGVPTALAAGKVPWGEDGNPGLLAAGRFGGAASLLHWRGQGHWELLGSTGRVAALAIAPFAEGGLRPAYAPRGPALRWPAEMAPAHLTPSWVNAEMDGMHHAEMDGRTADETERRWESSSAAIREPEPASDSPSALAAKMAASADARRRYEEQQQQRRGRRGGPNEAILLGTLVVLPVAFLAYHAARPEARAATILMRAGSPTRRPPSLVARLTDSAARMGAPLWHLAQRAWSKVRNLIPTGLL